MNQREQIAKAMYEAPDPGDDTVCPWPPSHPEDLAWWLSRGDAALTVFEEANVCDPGKADIPPVEMADNAHIPTDDERSQEDRRTAARELRDIGRDDEREALIALRLATHSKMMSDGYLSIVVRSNEEAADLVVDAGFHRTSTGWMFSPEECPNREHPFPEQCGLCGFRRTVQGEPTPGKRLDPDFRADLVDYAKARIQDVWADVPEGADAETLAQNVVAAQEFLWIARGFPVAKDPVQGEPTTITLTARGSGKTRAMIESMLAQANERGIRVEVVYPQGEPSDAQVLAAANAYMHYQPPYDDLSAFSDMFLGDMRAALRAAAAVQGGEHGA